MDPIILPTINVKIPNVAFVVNPGGAGGGSNVPVLTVGYSSTANYIVPAGATNAHTYVNSALAALNGWGEVLIESGTYTASGQILLKSNTRIRGAGIDSTIWRPTQNSGYGFTSPIVATVPTPINNSWLQDMTIDTQNLATVSAYTLYTGTGCGIKSVKFKNCTTWMVKCAPLYNITAGLDIDRFVIEDCVFDTHSGTLEMVLIANCTNFHMKGTNTFLNKNGIPSLGLWQKVFHFYADNLVFRNIVGQCIYYSTTCQDMVFNNVYAENTGTVVKGANVSDSYDESGFDTVWLAPAKNLVFNSITCIGGANSTAATGIQLGAVDGFRVTINKITKYSNPVVINNGNFPVSVPAKNGVIDLGIMQNNNPLDTVHLLNPVVLFGGTGGSINTYISGGQLDDTNSNPTQEVPVSFSGAATWSNVVLRDINLRAYNGRSSVNAIDGATLDTATVKFIDCTNTTKGSLSAYYYETGTGGGSTGITNDQSIVNALIFG